MTWHFLHLTHFHFPAPSLTFFPFLQTISGNCFLGFERMSVLAKNPTLKLFGKTIPLPLSQSASISDPPAASSDLSASHNSSPRQIFLSGAAYPKEKSADEEDDAGDDEETSRKSVSPEKQPESCVPHQNPEPTTSSGISENSRTSSVERETSAVKPSTNGEQNKTEEKTLKKPDKLLPCPRCNSMKTKFCYYNNYNVNQPRYFCKNCQRYWTAGGTMRSVPVGAGRRKNKSSSISPYRQLMVPISQVHNFETANASNGAVLSFGSSPSKPQNRTQNFPADQIGEDHSSRSSITCSNSSEKRNQTGDQERMAKKLKPFPSQIPIFTPPLQWSPQFQPPFFPSSSFPVSFYPIPFWGCSPPSSWFIPSPSPPSVSVSNSPAPMPTTLRIDDVSEAAKSSVNGGKLFQAFQSKGDEKSHFQTSPLLQANPAALSRSIKFHERT